MKQGRGGRVVQGRFGSQRGRSNWTQANDLVPARFGGEPGKRRSSLQGSGWSWRWIVPLWLGAAAVGTAYGAGAFDSQEAIGAAGVASVGGESGVRANFSLCHSGGGYNCVVDGDTIWLQGQKKIRIADIDTPETHQPRCASEKALGDKATQRLQQLLSGGAVTFQSIDRDEDRYGRKLRLVMVDGVSVGDTLVGEGLARPYAGGRKPWC